MAKIDTSKIDGYADMSAEDKLKALEAFNVPEPDYTGYVKKEIADKYASEASDYKKKYKESLSEDERKQTEHNELVEKMKSELEELKAEKTMSEHTASLLKLGYDENTAKEVAKATINGDFKTVYDLQSKFIENTKKNVESEIIKKTPAPNVGDGDKTITRDDFKKMSLSERQTLKDNDPETFAELSKL
jgi:hypothetical protein